MRIPYPHPRRQTKSAANGEVEWPDDAPALKSSEALQAPPMRPSGRRGRTISSGARGAKPQAHHGPLERLLEGLPPPPNKATQVTWHCLTARRRATPTSNETQRQTKPPRHNAPARAAAQRQRPRPRLSP